MNPKIIDDELKDISLFKTKDTSQNISNDNVSANNILIENNNNMQSNISETENKDNSLEDTNDTNEIDDGNVHSEDNVDEDECKPINEDNNEKEMVTDHKIPSRTPIDQPIEDNTQNINHNTPSHIPVDQPIENYTQNINNVALRFVDDDREIDTKISKIESNNDNIEKPSNVVVRPKHPIPKKILANQQKYLESLEKQNMLKTKKNKKVDKNKKVENRDQPSVRRINVAGKIKYLSASGENISVAKEEESKPSLETSLTQVPLTSGEEQNDNISKNKTNASEIHINHKIPSRYAKIIEKQIKKETEKNVKNFKDLRRIKALNDINIDNDLDVTKASITELRKLRIEQRKTKQAMLNNTKTKKESKIQEILSNDKLSKFSKLVAMNNLSTNSRHNIQKNIL